MSRAFSLVAAVMATGVATWTQKQLYPPLAAWAASAADAGQIPLPVMKVVELFRWAGYDVVTDGILTKSWLSGFVAYWLMCTICTAMDLFPGLFLRLKTQGSKSYFTVMEWLEAVGVSMFNMCILGWVCNIPNWCLRSGLYGEGVLDEDSPWTWRVEGPKIIVCIITVDFWFYWTHRVIHHPKLYKPIHKFHHRFTAPTAVACMYATPLEYLIGNLMGVALGPTISNAHPYTTYAWVAFALISTCGSHSGYKLFSAEGHDAHHEFFNYNFGVGGFMDRIFGTTWYGSPQWKRHQAKLKAKAEAAKAETDSPPKPDAATKKVQ